MVENGSTRFLTRFVSDKKSCVNGFHTGWASETSHQPVINAISVISMHTGKVANTIPNDEFNHANDTPILGEKKKVKKNPQDFNNQSQGKILLSILFTSIVRASG